MTAIPAWQQSRIERTHGLNGKEAWPGRRSESDRRTQRLNRRVFIPIRIIRLDRTPKVAQVHEINRDMAPVIAVPTAYYADRKTMLRILCGLV
jgi:hypothetical protein